MLDFKPDVHNVLFHGQLVVSILMTAAVFFVVEGIVDDLRAIVQKTHVILQSNHLDRATPGVSWLLKLLTA